MFRVGKWFQRKEEPIDCTQAATAYPDRAGAYAVCPEQPQMPPWNRSTEVIPLDRPLMTRAALWRSSHAVRTMNRRPNSKPGRYGK